MRNKIVFATAGAFGLLMAASAAQAGSSNQLYITQSGGTNSADVDQSNGNSNSIGLAATPALQNGNNNNIVYSNAGYAPSSTNAITAILQQGDQNDFRSSDVNASGNTITDATQDGKQNSMVISHNWDTTSTVGEAKEVGNNNVIGIYQGSLYTDWYPKASSGNTVGTAIITGNGNGVDTPGVAYPQYAGIQLQQGGIDNNIDTASVTGDNNFSWSDVFLPIATGTVNAISIEQAGQHNGQTASTATILGSNVNQIVVKEVGNYDNFSVQQGTSLASTRNLAMVTQTGSYDDATVTQSGSYNQVVVTQLSDANTATANFTGDSNGVGTFSGDAGALSHANLTEGSIYQDSTLAATGNSATYNVTGNSNLFAFAQIGGSNTINGTVGAGGASPHNQVAVLQASSGNSATFSQTGTGSNNASISQ